MGMRTAVIYARFSCSKQREASIKDQLRICEEWCEREGYAVVNRYCDRAVSGRTDDRPQFQEMIANAGESQIVLVYMMDRFSRDIYDAPIYKKRLRDKGVRVVSATEAMPDGPEALLLEKVYEGLAAIESAHISQRTRRGMEGNALKCMHNGVPVFGYSFGEDGKYVINEAEAEVVRECFARRAAGESANSIARDLAKRGYRTYAGNPVSHTFVNNMLHNEKYVGTYSWGNVRVENGMPALVTKEAFDMAGSVRARKQRASEDWGDFPLSGRAICGGCCMNLVGVSGRGRNGVKYEYYRCGHKCGVRPVRADWLDSEVAAAVRSILSDQDRVMEVARAVEAFTKDDVRAEHAADGARRRRDDADRAIKNLMRAISQGMDYDLAEGELERYQAQYAAASAEVETYENATRFDADDFAVFLQRGATLDDRQLLDAMVWQVMVGDDDVTVTLNYDLRTGNPARLRFARGSYSFAVGSDDGPQKEFEPASPADSPVRTNLVWLPG